MKFCETCMHWNHAYDDYPKKFGICNSFEAKESVNIFTANLFGCIYHQKEEYCVADIELPSTGEE